MESTNFDLDTASPVAQDKKGRVQDLGRGSCSKNSVQSPRSCLLPSGSEKDKATASGSGIKPTGPIQLETSLVSVTPGLTKTQRRNRRKRLAKKSSHESSSGADNQSSAGGGGTKRSKPAGSTPSPGVTKESKKPRRDSLPGDFASAVAAIKMAVVKDGFPAAKISAEEASLVNRAINDLIDQVPFEAGGPRMLGSNHSKGALIVSCYDSEAVDWMRNHLDGNKKVLENAELKVINASDLPKPCKVAFKTRDVHTEDPRVFLTRIERLNPSLKSRRWRVLQRTADSHCSRWILEVEAEDVEDIRRVNFYAFAGFDRGTFKVLQGPGKKAVEDKTECSTSSTSPSPPTSQVDSVSIGGLDDLSLGSDDSVTTLKPSSPCSTNSMDEAAEKLLEGDTAGLSPDLEM